MNYGFEETDVHQVQLLKPMYYELQLTILFETCLALRMYFWLMLHHELTGRIVLAFLSTPNLLFCQVKPPEEEE
jgi:hypothetical protein